MNIDIAFSEHKIGIGILVRNHLGIPFLAKALSPRGRYVVDYGELMGIIESYMYLVLPSLIS